MRRQEWTLTPELAATVESFSQLALALPGRMAAVCVEIEMIEARMRALAAQGTIRAVPEWHARKGTSRSLILVFAPDGSGQRARKYVGRDPVKVQEALDGLDRADEYDRLAERLYRLMAASFAASCEVSQALQTLTCYRR